MSILDDENILVDNAAVYCDLAAGIQKICKSIIENELNKYADCNLAISESDISYINQRELIGRLFNGRANCSVANTTSPCCCIYNKALIMLRLVVLDSLYSTNASYSHFTFDEMADKIWKLGPTEKHARDYFYQIACGKLDRNELFSTKYGIRKNLDEGGRQMSLMSKYAYYVLMADKENYPLGFPIYDRLAKASYNKIRKYKVFQLPSIDNVELPIEEYVMAINELRKSIFSNNGLFNGYQQFDILDAYLWRMGKFSDGNLTLLMNKEDYKKFIKNIGFANKSKKEILSIINSSEDANYFNKGVVVQMKRMNTNSFNDLSIETYLTELYNHWKNYF